jgi:hypothetical protein
MEQFRLAFIFASIGFAVSSALLIFLLVTRNNKKGLNRVWDVAALMFVTALTAAASGAALLLHIGS